MNCNKCKCNTCGRVNECEIITERLEYLDNQSVKECTPIINCSVHSLYKDTVRFNTWQCLIKNMLGGD